MAPDTAALHTLAGVPLTPDTARELSRAAKQVESFRQRRDALIVQAQAEGAGLREIARELSRAAKQVESFRQRRDALIVQAQAEGAGLREIARAVGLTHRAVAKIIERMQR